MFGFSSQTPTPMAVLQKKALKAKRMAIVDDQLGLLMKSKKGSDWFFAEVCLRDMMLTRITQITRRKKHVRVGKNLSSLSGDGANWFVCDSCGMLVIAANATATPFLIPGECKHPFTCGLVDEDYVFFGTAKGEIEVEKKREKVEAEEDMEVAYL